MPATVNEPYWNKRPRLAVSTFRDDPALVERALALGRSGSRLWAAWGNDETRQRDGCLKVYYLFVPPRGEYLQLLEYLVGKDRNIYPSFSSFNQEGRLFGYEIADFFGLTSGDDTIQPGFFLHDSYGNEFPMRIERGSASLPRRSRQELIDSARRGAGDILIGTEHKAINDPEYIVLHVENGHIKSAVIFLGYLCHLVELEIQTSCKLNNAVCVAERLSEPAGVSIGLSLSRAIEHLPSVRYKTTRRIEIMRQIVSSMASIVNNMFLVDTLLRSLFLAKHDAQQLSLIVDDLVKLNVELCGSPFLLGLVAPGGIRLTRDFDLSLVSIRLSAAIERFSKVVSRVAYDDDVRERMLGVGRLSAQDAERTGAVGNVKRASEKSGDFRTDHAFGIYLDEAFSIKFTDILKRAPALSYLPDLSRSEIRGDVYSRFVKVATEVRISAQVVQELIAMWKDSGEQYRNCYSEIDFDPNYAHTIAIGYDYGSAGEYLTWVKGDKLGGISRVVFCTPSVKNYAALCQSVIGESPDNFPLDVLIIGLAHREIDK